MRIIVLYKFFGNVLGLFSEINATEKFIKISLNDKRVNKQNFLMDLHKLRFMRGHYLGYLGILADPKKLHVA